MQSINTWEGKDWNLVNELQDELLSLLYWDDVVSALSREEELLVAIEDEISHVLLQVSVKYSSIVVILYSTSVHSFSNEISQGFPRKFLIIFFLSLVQVERNKSERDLEIGLIETVHHIPTDLTEFLSFLKDRVEES